MEAFMVCTVGIGTAADYYLDEQSEYYTGGKEPSGRWYAPGGAFGFEDGGAIDAGAFRKLHAGMDPSGTPLGRDNRSLTTERVGGYDLTFSAPKSISVLWAVAEPEVRSTIEQAQERAARSSLNVLREHAGYARRGKGGASLEKVEFLGATFQHGEARPTEREDGNLASDPQLHTHSVIFNIAERADGSWGALDGRHFFKWKMAAGAIYRAELAQGLRDLGFAIEMTDDGLFEVAGVPEEVRQHFSSRRSQIEGELKSRGLETKEAQALASAVTRTSRHGKSVDETAEARHARWRGEAEAFGFSEKTVAEWTQRRGKTEDLQDEMGFQARLADIPARLTEHEAVFREEAVYSAVAIAALNTGEGANEVEEAVSGLLDEGEIVEVGRDDLGLPVYSTQEMAQAEAELVELARQAEENHRHRLTSREVEPLVQAGGLSEEQRDAVRFVTEGSDIAVMEGSAGAGKTHALRTVCEVYRRAGRRVIGTSTAWRMANQLGDDLSMEAKATDAWLASDRAGKPFLDRNTVLIVDEAGQLSSRQMLDVLQAAEKAQAKVILTGDQRQLQAIGAGPGLRLVAEQVGAVRIDTIVRQRQEWARMAVTDLSLGRAGRAIAEFEQHDALKWCVDGPDAVRQAVSDWKSFKKTHPSKTAMVLARTNKQVAALNAEMRKHLRETGRLSEKEYSIQVVSPSGRSVTLAVSVGDQVLFKKRIDALGVINGTSGVVTGIVPTPSGLALAVNVRGHAVRFDTNEIADESGRVPLAHAYATTVYSAQGATVDSAFVVADHTMKRNEIYVAASRARDHCSIYVDRNGVEQAVRSRMDLADPNRSEVSEVDLQKYLSAAWGAAQTKSSTRDFLTEVPIPERVIGSDFHVAQEGRKARMRLPSVSLTN